VSLVVPTRDRPDFLRYCLEAIKSQSFTDFEVIVSDNSTRTPCKQVFDQYADERFRYVRPPSPLLMHDNWEFACSFASGKYVAVLIDKTILYPSALKIMHSTLEKKPAEIVTWWNDSFLPLDENASLGRGRLICLPQKLCSPYYFNPKRELARRYRLDVKRGTEGVHYYWGKICFGAYHGNLIQRIKTRAGRLFHPACPEYAAMLAALTYTDSAVDLGQPLLTSFITKRSTGRQTEENDDFAASWFAPYDPSHLDAMPLRGLYTSMHNLVAADYVFMKKTIGEPMKDLALNVPNLMLRAREDLDKRKTWQNPQRRRQQYEIWQRFFAGMSHAERSRYHWSRFVTSARYVKNRVSDYKRWFVARRMRTLAKLPKVGSRAAQYLRRHPSVEIMIFDNIIDAARFADELYAQVKPKH